MTMTDMIQPGWEVWDSEGEQIGRITRLEGNEVVVKQEWLLGGEYRFERSSVESAEEGRVNLSMTRQQLESSAR